MQYKELVNYVDSFCKGDGIFQSKIANLKFSKHLEKSGQTAIIYEPSICIILQGSKAVGFGENMYGYDTFTYLLAASNIPANIQIKEANKEKPFIALSISFDINLILEVLKELNSYTTTYKKNQDVQEGLFFDKLDFSIKNSVSRLVSLCKEESENSAFLASLITKELLCTLLQGKSGEFLKQYALEGTTTNQIAKIISEIKENFKENLNMANIAKKFAMSESSMYHNFKKMTALSPLQFQKNIRLQEAKNLLLNQNETASEVAFLVGYESPSQFSREYAKMFGLPPKAHINKIRQSFGMLSS